MKRGHAGENREGKREIGTQLGCSHADWTTNKQT